MLDKLKAPNTYLLIFSLIVVAAILTWIVPAGEFDTVTKNIDGMEKDIVVQDSYHRVKQNPQGFVDVIAAPFRGLVDEHGAQVATFILLVGGAFGVFQRTEAVDRGLKVLVQAEKENPYLRKLVIPLFMTLFSLGGATFGMAEETIPFVLIFVPMAISLGYDSIVGVAIPFVGSGAGFAGAFLNPFTVGIAQGIAELPPFSGFELRVVVWILTTAIAITFVMIYAEKIKKDPRKSLTYDLDQGHKEDLKKESFEDVRLETKHKIVLFLFMAALVAVGLGATLDGWYIEEIAGVFFLTGIVLGIAGRLKVNEITDSFAKGAQDLVGTVLVLALARGILVIVEDGQIIHTILYGISNLIGGFHSVFSSFAMYFVQTFINTFVPSGSGQAALTMPIMAPLSDLVGVSRQTAVLAYQFGDGFTNLIIPTSAVLMGVLSIAKIPWDRWARWIIPLQLILGTFALIMLTVAYLIGY